MAEALEERLARAVRLREGGDPGRARELLLDLRGEYPSDARVAYQTAWAHDVLGLEAEAVPHYRAAIAGDLSGEEMREALLGLGSTLRALGRDEEAGRVFEQGVQLFPDFRPLRVFRALLRYNTGENREAVADLLRLLVETTADPEIQRYQRAVTAYAEDLDRSWLDGTTVDT
ncbi:tetratricopeptide (TPR) repeat protein [Actinoplanes lutulentus]|uniref:Tetratricopeptide repeat protein n=1 Tax=Actinoplanes lutulentus TaxID=1287878 RepID=A0A327Z528_9ACTN|nr:tetratricopeptide repeat protein [Actinoplanes lutulentus]MBB2947708.1 tetratricopeptide (TPR) repeat protein [Actinoplanes lutulentus]RAK27763.1 tetratricopeptide repeat protein [Actinoplanes lutulentus]